MVATVGDVLDIVTIYRMKYSSPKVMVNGFEPSTGSRFCSGVFSVFCNLLVSNFEIMWQHAPRPEITGMEMFGVWCLILQQTCHNTVRIDAGAVSTYLSKIEINDMKKFAYNTAYKDGGEDTYGRLSSLSATFLVWLANGNGIGTSYELAYGMWNCR